MTACGVYALDVFSVCVLARHHAETTGYPVFEYHNRALGKPGGFLYTLSNKCIYVLIHISSLAIFPICDAICYAMRLHREDEKRLREEQRIREVRVCVMASGFSLLEISRCLSPQIIFVVR